MTDVVFNSFMFFEKLKDAGVPERQAKVQTELMQEIVEEKLATKSDIMLLKADLKELELRLDNRIKELELRMTLRLGAIMAASIAVVAAIVKI